MVFCGSGHDDGEAGGLGKPHRAEHERKMRAGQFVTGRWGQIQVDDVAPLGEVGLLAQTISLPARFGIRSGPQIAGVTPLSSSCSVHFFRDLARRMEIVSPLTRTFTDSPSFSLSRSTPSCGMRTPRLLPQRATLLILSTIPVAII